MNPLRNPHLRALGLTALFALACASDGAPPRTSLGTLSPEEEAKLARWDQARVTQTAEQLVTAINEVYVSVNTLKTGAQVGSGQANSFLRLKDRVRVARNEARHLATQLKDGRNRQETVLSYERLMTVIRDARIDGRKMFIEEPTLDKISTAEDLLRRLSPYYDPQANTGSDEKRQTE